MNVGVVTPDPQTQRAVERALRSTDYRLAWHAATGVEALRRIDQQPLDVLLLGTSTSDLSAPELTRRVLAKGPCSILLLAHPGDDGVSVVYEAMGAGALDVVAAPTLSAQGEVSGSAALFAKLRTAARLLGSSSGRLAAVASSAAAISLAAPPLVAIGASTGGPQALLTILTNLPRKFSAAIVIVQHVDAEFSPGLASWLQETSGIHVEIARNGVSPTAGTALLAGTEEHLVMSAGKSFRYVAEPRDVPHRPSVDVLFASLAQHWRGPGAAVLLTGMGKDGAEGMRKLRQAGWHTVAQDEETSVVYGMPRAAVQLGAACRVLPIGAVAGDLAGWSARTPPLT